MLRRVGTIAFAVSLLLCAGVIVLWARSYNSESTVDHVVIVRNEPTRSVFFLSNPGAAWIGVAPATVLRNLGWGDEVPVCPGVVRVDYPPSCRLDSFRVSYWLLTSVTATAPLAWMTTLWRRNRRRRGVAGYCLSCGYDLHATPERCPECGTDRKIQNGA